MTSSGPGLLPLDAQPRFIRYLRDLWIHRDLAFRMALNDHRSENHGYVLGRLWFLLTPLLRIGVYALVFGVILAGRRPENFIVFLAIGIFLFRFIQESITKGSTSLSANQALLHALYFPRAVLPLSAVLRQFLSFRYEATVTFAVVVAVTGSVTSKWLLFAFVLTPLATIFALGGAFLLAPLVTRVRDMTKVLPFVFRLFFYLSGVLFPIGLLVDGYPILRFLPFVPFYAYIGLGRHLLLAPDPDASLLWVSGVLWASTALIVGVLVFIRGEHHYGR
jgi:teichoic acid transport system permease protein